jgi:dethiobiotin synthetase
LEGRRVSLTETLEFIRGSASQEEILLLEGAGGLLSPLGEGFNAADLIQELGGEVLLVAVDRLGVLNEVLLTVEALKHRKIKGIKLALVEQGFADVSHHTNRENLEELVGQVEIVTIPFLHNYMPVASFIRESVPGLSSILRQLI